MSIAEVRRESAFIHEALAPYATVVVPVTSSRGSVLPPASTKQKPAPGPKCGKRHRGRVRADLVNDSSLPLQRLETTRGGPLMRNLFALVLTVLTLLIGGSAVGMIVTLPAAATCQTCGGAYGAN